ncbi:MAG: hypothetical protein KatS3mg020_1033 [Fimbriimonadales bacterium]|nr:MAG: hypothetical protein KatS3mg020_1033 [Fimbriimonadales bacterium]
MDYPEQPEWGAWFAGLDRKAPAGEAIENALRWLMQQTQAQQALLLLPTPNQEQVEFAYVVGSRADELRGFRIRPCDTLLESTIVRRAVWNYHATTHQEPIGAITTGLATPLPSLPLSALVLLNSPKPFDAAHRASLQQCAPPIELLVRIHHLQAQLEQRERALNWLSRLPKRIGAELSLQHALEAIESLMRKASPLGGGVWLYDENHKTLLQAVQYGALPMPPQIDPVELPDGWRNESVVLHWSGRTHYAYALTLTEQPIGLLVLTAPPDAPDAFDWIPPLLGHIALTLSNALLYEQTARRAQHMAKLYDLSLQLGETNSLRAVLSLLCRTAHELVPHDYTVVYLPSRHEPDRLSPVYVEPMTETLARHSADAQYSLPGWVYAFNAPIAAPDLAQHPQNLKEPLPGGFASALAVPLQVAERTLGVLLLLTESPHEFTLSEVELVFTLANTGALRLHTLERVHA